MWRPEEEITADLASDDPERVRAALVDLVDAMEEVDEFPVAPPPLELLELFGENPPREVQEGYLRLLANYESFVPELSRLQRLERLAELAIRYADSFIALEAGMEVKIQPDAAACAVEILRRMAQRRLASERELQGAVHYLSYMLAGQPEVREAVVRALATWRRGAHRQVVERLAPELSGEEKRELGIPDGS